MREQSDVYRSNKRAIIKQTKIRHATEHCETELRLENDRTCIVAMSSGSSCGSDSGSGNSSLNCKRFAPPAEAEPEAGVQRLRAKRLRDTGTEASVLRVLLGSEGFSRGLDC